MFYHRLPRWQAGTIRAWVMSPNGTGLRRCAHPLERIRVLEDSRVGAMWLSGASKCERSETRGAPKNNKQIQYQNLDTLFLT